MLRPEDSVFAPAPLQRPKSALTLRVRNQLAHVKSMSVLVSSAALRGEGTLQLEDLTSGKLLLDHDGKLMLQKASHSREEEMRDIVNARQQRAEKAPLHRPRVPMRHVDDPSHRATRIVG